MYSLTRSAALIAAMIVAYEVDVSAFHSNSNQANQNKEATGSISGRVTLADKPASGVTVMLTPGEPNVPLNRPVARTTTDEDGRFQLTRVPAGSYMVQTFSPAFIGPSDMNRRAGKSINLNDGETVEGIDIALTRGGVITGRIADADGQPLIQEAVHLIAVNELGQKNPIYLPYSERFTTDDRGVYRVFGVPPGRYIVSAGIDANQNYARSGFANTYYALIYYPGVTDQSRAEMIEVTSGGEATGIDITLGRVGKTYEASGRIINADTGKPVAGMNYGFGSLQPNGNSFGSSSITSSTTNSRGEFRLEGVFPGRYAAFAGTSREETDLYGDPVLFQVTDADVTGIEIRVHRGSSVTGVVVLDGASDQNGAPKVSDVRIGVSVSSQSLTTPSANQINIGPDGSFRATGLRPGNAHFFVMTYPPPKGLSLVRVEHDGVEQPGGVEIRAGEQVAGVKVIFGYGTGTIRGQASVEGGVLPEGLRMAVKINRAGGKPVPVMPAFPDARGRFSFEGLLPGDYEISLYAVAMAVGVKFRPGFVKQTVSVSNQTEAQVTLVIDLNENK